MILLPANDFEMGYSNSNNKSELLIEHSLPIHTVELEAFYIDVHEVTVGQFKRFINDVNYMPSIVDNDWKSFRVLRGGAWISPEENLRVANRYVAYDSPENMGGYDGFRCAVDIEQ